MKIWSDHNCSFHIQGFLNIQSPYHNHPDRSRKDVEYHNILAPQNAIQKHSGYFQLNIENQDEKYFINSQYKRYFTIVRLLITSPKKFLPWHSYKSNMALRSKGLNVCLVEECARTWFGSPFTSIVFKPKILAQLLRKAWLV